MGATSRKIAGSRVSPNIKVVLAYGIESSVCKNGSTGKGSCLCQILVLTCNRQIRNIAYIRSTRIFDWEKMILETNERVVDGQDIKAREGVRYLRY